MPGEPKTAKTAKSSAAANPFEAFGAPMSGVEIPAVFRDLTEKSIGQVRDGYAKMKDATEEATGLAEQTYQTAREGAFAIGVKTLDAAKANSDASFAFAKDLVGAKTFADVIELQTAFARKQFDALGTHVKEIQELSQKLVVETTKPVSARVEKAFSEIKTA